MRRYIAAAAILAALTTVPASASDDHAAPVVLTKHDAREFALSHGQEIEQRLTATFGVIAAKTRLGQRTTRMGDRAVLIALDEVLLHDGSQLHAAPVKLAVLVRESRAGTTYLQLLVGRPLCTR